MPLLIEVEGMIITDSQIILLGFYYFLAIFLNRPTRPSKPHVENRALLFHYFCFPAINSLVD